MEINRMGCTRIVILTKRLAFKLPNVQEWRLFLLGLLANMQEVRFSKANYPELCPVRFYLPLGFLVVMPRARILTVDEFVDWDVEKFLDRKDYRVPAEAKWTSFGWLDGKIVAVDYGN